MGTSRGPGRTYVGAMMAGGLIAMPVAMLPGHSIPMTSATARASASPPASAPTAIPGLSISVTDGRTAVKPGDQLTYLVSVKNVGTVSASHLKITQSLPAGLAFVSASSNGVAANGQVAWLTSIATGGAETFRVVTRVTQPPVRLLRLAAVACAAQQGSARPLVCAAHLDRLPAVAAASAATASGSPGRDLPAYLGGAVAVLAIGALLTIFGRRAIRRRQPG